MSDSSSDSGSRQTMTDPARALDGDHRFRCTSCGNVTRFDVVVTSRTRRYHHYDLGGVGQIEDEEVLDRHVESVTCRWCGRSDAVSVEPAPVATGRAGDA